MKLLALALSLISFSAFSGTTLEVPAKDLIIAVKTISTTLEVQGQIECTAINTGSSPAISICVIDVDGNTAIIDNAEDIIRVTQQQNPPTGPYYSVSGSFEIKNINNELRAFITLE